MKLWQFQNPVKIYSGNGSIDQLNKEINASDLILIVTSQGMVARGTVSKIISCIGKICFEVYSEIESNPSLTSIETATSRLIGRPWTKIIALGGGSVIDTAKVLSVCLANANFSINRYFQESLPIPNQSISLIAIPTTSGTGSEVTPFATVWDTELRKKLSISGNILLPNIAILDSTLTLDLPWIVTLSSGLDAITQAFESIWNINNNLICAALSTQSIQEGLRVLPLLKTNSSHLELRQTMLESSLLAGLAISQTRTALCHSISYPLTAHYNFPHGLACAFTLLEVLKFNIEDDDGRLIKLAKNLGYSDLDNLFEKINDLLSELNFSEIAKSFLPNNLESLLLHLKEMQTPGRSNNNMRSASLGDIAQIVKYSYMRYLV